MTKSICIAGKNKIAVRALGYVLSAYSGLRILCLANPEDDEKDSWQPSLAKYASDKNVSLVDVEELSCIEDLVLISLEYSCLLRTDKFISKKLFNIHFSLLPKYKGMYTSYHPIANGERYSGVTLHKIDSGIDTGDIVDQIQFEIPENCTGFELYSIYLEQAYELFEKNIHNLIYGKVGSYVQPITGSSYYSKNSTDFMQKEINCRATAYEICNWTRAMVFRPFQLPTFSGVQIIQAAAADSKSQRPPGDLLDETLFQFTVSTIDYNVIFYKDYLPQLFSAVETDNESFIVELLQHKLDLDIRDCRGITASMLAIESGNLKMLKFLLESGADVNVRTIRDGTLLDIALEQYLQTQDRKIFEFLLGSGICTNSKDIYDQSIRHKLSDSNCVELLSLL